MDEEIIKLEQQVEQLITLYETSKTERRDLHARVVALETENRNLAQKVQMAVSGVETMLNKLPEA